MLEELVKLGFSEHEAHAYLILLRNGPSLASTLAVRTGLKRASIYSILDTLTARGLVSFEVTEAGRRYLPHDPECLLYNIEQERVSLQLKLDLAKNCVAKLLKPQQLTLERSRKVSFLKGSGVIREMIHDFLDPYAPLFLVLSAQASKVELDLLNFIFKKFEKNLSKGVVLSPLSVLRNVKLSTPHAIHPSPAEKGQILIQGQKVLFMTYDIELELMSIVDAKYAEATLQVLVLPHCKNSGSLALSSSIS